MPQIIKGYDWTVGEIVTADNLDAMIDAAILDPSAVTAQADFPTLTGNEYALIVDPASGLLKKTQLKNSLLTGNDLESNQITTALIYGGTTDSSSQQLTISTNEGLLISNGDTSASNNGVSIQSNGGNLDIIATNSGFGHGNGLITISSGSSGINFTSSGTGTANFAQRAIFNATSAIKLPVGTTAQRPATPVAGDIRFNSTTVSAESYDGTVWAALSGINSVSKSANGYIKLENGICIQWGTFLTNGSSTPAFPQIITLPTSFTTAIVYANLSPDGANSSGVELTQIDWSTSGKTTTSQLGIYSNYIGTCKFFAVGY